MPIVTKEALFEKIRKKFENDTDDETLTLIEDITDTVNSMDSSDWKSKYEENDKMWRNKFKEKFFNSATDDKSTDSDDDQKEPEKPEILTFDKLFTEDKK